MKSASPAKLNNEEAWRQYRTAFQEYSQMARKVQLLTNQHMPDRAAIDAALLDLERVRVIYNSRRDALARQLLASSEPDGVVSPHGAGDRNTRVKRIAELLWEFSGRPDGSADDDWHRAEEILRRASAA